MSYVDSHWTRASDARTGCIHTVHEWIALIRWRVDKKLFYSPTTTIIKRITKMVIHLSQQHEPVQMTELSRRFGVSPLWITRCDQVGIIRLTSTYDSANLGYHKNPYKLYVQLANVKMAKKLLKLPVEKPKMKTSEDLMADRMVKELEEQDASSTP